MSPPLGVEQPEESPNFGRKRKDSTITASEPAESRYRSEPVYQGIHVVNYNGDRSLIRSGQASETLLARGVRSVES
jgi:hypothetical protein